MKDGSVEPAPVVMLHRTSNITERTREVLSETHVRPYGEFGIFNWWFPEGDKCQPGNPGYKRFYLNSWMNRETLIKHCGESFAERVEQGDVQLHDPWTPLIWPLLAENRDQTLQYLLYRELPSSLTPGSRDMEVWMRKDLVAGTGTGDFATSRRATSIPLLADQAIGESANLNNPTGIAVDDQGRIYVADTMNHRIVIFDADGQQVQTIGSFGNGEGQFYEPRGIAVDEDGFIYVTDTWNARVVKLSAEGEWLLTWGTGDDMGTGDQRRAFVTDGSEASNNANELGLYGPRGIAIDPSGNIHITDTGNKRIVVTDNEGNYLYQWGYGGSGLRQFNEPTGLGIDALGRVYVADTWNSRVQVFTDVDSLAESWPVAGWSPGTYDDPSLTVSPEGQVLVSVPTEHQVMLLDRNGEPLIAWGGSGSSLSALNSPSGLAVGPNGSIYVVDRQLHRVLRFTLPRLDSPEP